MPINTRANLELLPAALIFEAVARRRSFRAAATELKLSPSTVSARISALEEALGVRLLHRTTRSVSLTDAGHTLRDEIAPILPQWKRAEASVRAHATEPQGTLVVTAADIFMSNLVARVTTSFRQRYPATRIALRTTLATLPLVEEGVDVAVRAGPLSPSEHGSRLLWSGAHIAVAAPSLLANSIATTAELMEAPSVELLGRRKLSGWRSASGETAEHAPTVVVEADTVHTYMSLLVAGAGVGFLPELLAAPDLRAGTLTRVLPDWVSDAISFHVVTPSTRRHGAAVTRFVDALVQEFGRQH